MQWAIAVCLRLILKDGPETSNRNFDPPGREWLPRFGIVRGIIWMGSWRTLHSPQILHAPSAISVYVSVLPGRPRARALLSADRVTALRNKDSQINT